MKRGFTLIEVLISISILAVILLVLNAVYIAGIKEFPRGFEKSKMQTDLNFSLDSIGMNIKDAFRSPSTYTNGATTFSSGTGSYTHQNSLILELPAVNSSGEFIYSGSALQPDVVVYYLSGGNLYKRVYGNPAGRLSSESGQPKAILKNVSSFACTYTPAGDPITISCNANVAKNIYGKAINLNATKTANLRNRF
jgi:prepilin-type N-terminal cleavage/methylation domain-containing protein